MQFKALILSSLVSFAAAASICFDAGDCLLAGGGQCVKASGQLLGYVTLRWSLMTSTQTD